ncbi:MULTISPECIES: hypothetical protein [Empedobacter]|uniref:hypothetical protein n=1 Tax=Empedobacter TaxID=59734 RepID=UPI001C8E71F3|nr:MULTISPECIES: hypothetical protein [Empedobacter]MBY0067767.1 hypothetical protein [Empedobacter falsenii]MDM1138418.1 hypothetical protein [Empedobacter sp. R132-2]
MKPLLFFLFPIALFAQEVAQNDNLKNKLLMNFTQQSGYFDFKYSQDLSLEKNNELILDNVKNYINQPTSISPLKPIEERIEYKYDDTMTNRENLIRSVIHEMFLSKPLKLSK